MTRLRVLVYKRTHNGDPDQYGCFGAHDCMGAVRGRDFDAVIGVGGVGSEADSSGIAGKVNWIGIGPHKLSTPGMKWPVVTFDHFRDFGKTGPKFRSLAPNLAERMYSKNIRHVIDDLTECEYIEVSTILSLAESSPPSPGWPEGGNPVRRICGKAKKPPNPDRVKIIVSWGILEGLDLVEEFPYSELASAERRLAELHERKPGRYRLQKVKTTGGRPLTPNNGDAREPR
jgi:hypothetical protein